MNLRTILATMITLTLLVTVRGEAQDEYKRQNLGPNVNSKYVDGSPLISPDGKTLFFVRDDKVDQGKLDYDIWFSELGNNGSWEPAKKIGSGLNNDLNNQVLAISPDGNTLYLLGSYGSHPIDVRGISVTQRTAKGWSTPTELKFAASPNDWGSYDITLNSDGNVMMLSLQSDLYVSFLGRKGIWTEPKKIDATLNTSNYEYTPFLAADNKTLYFSSGGHGSMGDNDIFRTTRLDNTWLKWSKPINMGPAINSTEWESYFRISAAGDYAYVLSWKGGYGKADIFRIKLRDDQMPSPVVLVRGRVLDAKTKKPLAATIRYEVLGSKEQLGTATTDPNSGEYKIVLPGGQRYGFYAEAEGYLPINDNIDLVKLASYREIKRDLLMVKSRKGAVVRLNNIFFETGSADLQSESSSELDRVVEMLQKNPGMRIEIAGHTDDVGDKTSNLSLSKNRAVSVREYLLEKGISENRLLSKGFGETKPVTSNKTDDGRAQNRRVEFRILQ